MGASQSLTLTQSSQNTAENYSMVRVLWKSTQSGESHNNFTRSAKYYVSINGGAETVYTVSYTLPKGTTKTILDTTIKVPHKTDGTGTVRVRTWMDTQISEGVITQSKTLTLTPISRATTPTFYANTVEMGKTATIYLYGGEGYVHDLYYSFEAGSYQLIDCDLGSVCYWAVPDLADQIPSKTSGAMTIKCVTRSGSTTIGTTYGYFTVTVPTSEAYMPKITAVAVTEATEGIAAQFGAFVKGQSTLSVSVTAHGAKGSTINVCSTTLEGMKYTGLRFTSGVLTGVGKVTMVTTVTDTRGRTAQLPTEITVLDYYLPKTTAFSAYRVDENGNAKSDGNYLAVAYAYEAAPVGNKNTATVKLEYKRSTASSWSKLMETTGSYTANTVRSFTTRLSSDYQFDIRLTVTDWFGNAATYPATLPTAKVILDFKANGKGIAAGKTSEFDGFEVDMPANCESFNMIGVRNYELSSGAGYVLYNNGLLIQWGSVSVTPTAVNTVAQLTVVFPIPYVTRPHITGTLLANSPQGVSWSMGVGTTEQAAVSSLVIYLYRSTLYATPFRWMAVGQVDPTKLPEVTT